MHCNKGQFENSDTKVIFGSTSPIDVNSVDQSNFKRNRRNKIHFLLLRVVALWKELFHVLCVFYWALSFSEWDSLHKG